MRLIAAICCLLLIALVARADEEAAPVFTLQQQWQSGWAYTDSESEKTSTSVVFQVPQRDGGRMRVSGSISDVHERALTRTPADFDDDGATRILVNVDSHRLRRSEVPPGETASKLTHNGQGPLTGAQWREDWKEDHWASLLTRAATSEFGALPPELKTAMLLKRKSRHHFMLPGKDVAIGEKWKPAVADLATEYQRFARRGDDFELKAECTLESANEAEAVIVMEWKAQGLKPTRAATGSEWKAGTKLTLEGKATLTLNRADHFVHNFKTETTIKLVGELWNSGAWLEAEATLTSSTTVTTSRKVVNE